MLTDDQPSFSTVNHTILVLAEIDFVISAELTREAHSDIIKAQAGALCMPFVRKCIALANTNHHSLTQQEDCHTSGFDVSSKG
jgi:hypothetical protein